MDVSLTSSAQCQDARDTVAQMEDGRDTANFQGNTHDSSGRFCFAKEFKRVKPL